MFGEMFERYTKVIPLSFFIPIVLIFFIGWFYAVNLELDLRDDTERFYKVELNNSIDRVIEKPQMICYKMDTTWYFIAAEFNAYLQEGDSISKEKDSVYLKIYNSKQKMKWQGEIKGKIFFEISDIAPVAK